MLPLYAQVPQRESRAFERFWSFSFIFSFATHGAVYFCLRPVSLLLGKCEIMPHEAGRFIHQRAAWRVLLVSFAFVTSFTVSARVAVTPGDFVKEYCFF